MPRTLILSLLVVMFTAVCHAQDTVPLIKADDPTAEWSFDNGREFPGAKGGLEVDETVKRDGRATLKLTGDFSGGGNYVQIGRPLKGDASVLSFWIKYPGSTNITLRVIDGSGQCHQFNLKLKESDDFQSVVLPLKEFFENKAKAGALPIVGKYENWGGKKDGKWYGPARDMYLLVGAGKERDKPRIAWFDDVKMVTTGAASASPYVANFEKGDLKDWTTRGGVAIDDTEAFKSKRALLLNRPKDEIEKPINAVGPTFIVSPGIWEVSLAAKVDLDSPDSSFSGVATLELLNAEGKVAKTITMADLYRQRNWQPAKQKVEVGSDVVSARFAFVINKAAGKFWVDELSATFAAPLTKKESNVRRLLFQTAQVGNLIFPEDPKTVTVTVEATRRLPEAQRQFTWVVQDYFGAEVAPIATAKLEPKGTREAIQLYEAALDLAPLNLKVGPYYEIHASIAAGGDPVRNYTSLAILPEAVTRKYKPEEVPFTSRNWDNRVPAYVTLTDRLGIRIVGIWGGWSAEAPYKPHAPQIELAKKLGMGVLTGTSSGAIEQHNAASDKWTEEGHRQGMQNWLKQFGDVRPLIICLGNEPHATEPAKVKRQADAYRYIYEEVKKFDPTIKVIATSVPATEEYFKQGFQNSCDMYDYHVYETPANVGEGVKSYQKMSAKYDAPKPVWSTEIGLNSQGMARLAVANDMRRKFAYFFAAGGENISWFGLLYPDPQGTGGDSSSSAHNVFDSRYSRYAPKLDAISYYNLVNGICIKKFVEEKSYENGVRSFLFRDRDGKSLQILWTDKGRTDIGLPLAGVKAASSVRITGDRSEFTVQNDVLTLTVSDEPVLVEYDNGPAKLADKLAEPGAAITSLPTAAIRGEKATILVSDKGLTFDALVPAGWKVSRGGSNAAAGFAVTAPDATNAREAQVAIQIKNGDAIIGELYARIPVAGKIGLRVVPEPVDDKGNAGAKVIATNNGNDVQVVTWKLDLLNEQKQEGGRYKDQPQPASAYLNGPAEGTLTLKPGQATSVVVPMAGVDPNTVYRVKASLTDPTGRTMERDRYLAGFMTASRAKAQPKLDGVLDEADWAKAQPASINEERQLYMLSKKDVDTWTGPDDLSAVAKYLWDDKYLYVGVTVKDDKFTNPKSDGSLWAQDGLQFLVDPARESKDKPGKYDYTMGLGTKGPQAWCHLSADAGTPSGEVKDIVVATKRAEDGSGGITYELAIPWARLAPFKPAVGANLALTLALNEDDGLGRNGFMNWFGDVQGKSADNNGDIMLKE